MDFTKFVSLLDTRALYFTNLEKMSEFDPFEGLYTRANLAYDDFLQHSSFDALPEELRKQFVDKATFESYLKVLPSLRPYAKEQRRINYVNCWHKSSYESAALWKIYLKSDEGIAIQSTVDRLKESISRNEEFEVFIGEVIYVDYNTFAIPGGNLLAPFLYKRQSFEYEHELRALSSGMQYVISGGKVDMSAAEKAPPGLSITTDLDILIDKIYASPGAEAWFVQLLNSVCSHYNLTKEVAQSDLASKLY